MYLFESLNQLIQTYLPEDQIKRLRQAYLVARDAQEGQTRSSGEPYITHPVAVACILAEMKLDYETLMAALLHDVIEDTPATYQDMEQLFGKSVAELVEGVSKLDKLKFRDKKEAQAENFRKMIMRMTRISCTIAIIIITSAVDSQADIQRDESKAEWQKRSLRGRFLKIVFIAVNDRQMRKQLRKTQQLCAKSVSKGYVTWPRRV